jgi:hypothetical protein
MLFSILAFSIAFVRFLRSRCKSSWPLVANPILLFGVDVVEDDSEAGSDTRLGETDRGVDEVDDEEAG